MKTTRALSMLFFGMLVHASLFAQTVDFLVVSKVHEYVQTDNSTAVDAVNAWRFEAHVEGTSVGGANATLGIPSGSGSTTMIYNGGGDKWGINAAFVDQASLDAAYGSGNYSLTAYGQTISTISVTGNTYPLAPLATDLSGGTIVGGILTWNVAQALTITITGTADHMGMNIFGDSYNANPEAFAVGHLTFIIPATTLVAGNSYTVELNFDDIVGGTSPTATGGSGALLNANYAGVYNATTTFTIQAIPEPSTYAAIFGAVTLAGVMLYRRRRIA